MLPYSILMFVVSAIFIVFSILIYRGRTELIHSYHRENVTDRVGYGKAFGKALLVVAASPLVSGIIGLLGTQDRRRRRDRSYRRPRHRLHRPRPRPKKVERRDILILNQIRLPRLGQALLFRDHAAILLHFFFYQRKINTVFNAEFGLVSHS